MASENVTIHVYGTFSVPKKSLIVQRIDSFEEVDVSDLSAEEINELIQTDCYLDLGNSICGADEERADISIS